jgi:hypothetical protein
MDRWAPHGAGQVGDITDILKVPCIKSGFIGYNSARLRECLPSFGAIYFVFQSAIQKLKK